MKRLFQLTCIVVAATVVTGCANYVTLYDTTIEQYGVTELSIKNIQFYLGTTETIRRGNAVRELHLRREKSVAVEGVTEDHGLRSAIHKQRERIVFKGGRFGKIARRRLGIGGRVVSSDDSLDVIHVSFEEGYTLPFRNSATKRMACKSTSKTRSQYLLDVSREFGRCYIEYGGSRYHVEPCCAWLVVKEESLSSMEESVRVADGQYLK